MSRKQKKESFFWTSYSDLMTSMFFVMLVLFVLAIALLHHKVVEITRIKNATDKIQKLEASISRIDTAYFQYDSVYKRHTLKDVSVEFEKASSDINDLDTKDLVRLKEAGMAIVAFMQQAKVSLPDAEYMVIVEGQSSRDSYYDNDGLSYRRALSLVNYWKENGIVFDRLPCEIIISGSGYSSRFRVQPDVTGNKANQRFVIHIIPKPGNFEKK